MTSSAESNPSSEPSGLGAVSDPARSLENWPPETLREYFGAEVRRLRHAAKLSQEQLAEQIKYSGGLVSMVETCSRMPSQDFTERCDKVLGADGALIKLWPMLAREIHPKWFRSFVTLEADAVALHEFEILAVPGLLQTEAYARANLAPLGHPSRATNWRSHWPRDWSGRRFWSGARHRCSGSCSTSRYCMRPVGTPQSWPNRCSDSCPPPNCLSSECWYYRWPAARVFPVDGAFVLIGVAPPRDNWLMSKVRPVGRSSRHGRCGTLRDSI